jgi:hypothetical protein
MELLKLRAKAVALAMMLATSAQAATSACTDGGQRWLFEGAARNGGFSHVQLQRGEAELREDPEDAENQVARLTAGAKKWGKVGKADFIHRFEPLGAGVVISMQARVYFPPDTPLNSIILMDLECASCGVDTNPGVRLYLRRGLLRVDRSKIGIKEPFLPMVPRMLRHNTWHHITWELTLGEGGAGHSKVLLDGELISDASGTTMLTQTIVSRHTDLKVLEQADRFQVGLTANSNASVAVMLLDDVQFCTQ